MIGQAWLDDAQSPSLDGLDTVGLLPGQPGVPHSAGILNGTAHVHLVEGEEVGAGCACSRCCSYWSSFLWEGWEWTLSSTLDSPALQLWTHVLFHFLQALLSWTEGTDSFPAICDDTRAPQVELTYQSRTWHTVLDSPRPGVVSRTF